MAKSPLTIPEGVTIHFGKRRLKGEIPADLAARLPKGCVDSLKAKKSPTPKTTD